MAYPIRYDANGNPIPPWVVDDEGQSVPTTPDVLPFDPGPTPIPQAPPQPQSSGVNALPVAQATPPWQPPANDSQDYIPPWAAAESQPRGNPIPAEPPPAPTVPPWLQATHGVVDPLAQPQAQVDAISGGSLPSMDQIKPPGPPQPDLYQKEQQNIQQMGGLQEQKDAIKSQVYNQGLTNDQFYNFANEQMRKERERKVEAAHEQLVADTNAYANGRVDPNRWHERQGFANNLVYGITGFLVGMANPTGPNSMVEWVQNQIDNDLQAQRQDIATKGNALNAKNNLYADLVKQYGDANIADEAFRANKWALVGKQLAAVDQSFAAPEDRIKTQQAMVEAEKQRKAAEASFALKLYDKMSEDEKRQFDMRYKAAELEQRDIESRRQAGVTMRGQDISVQNNREDNATQLEIEREKQKKAQEALNRGYGVADPVSGKPMGYFQVGSETEWRQARDAGYTYQKGKAAYEEYIALMKEGTLHPLNDKQRSRAKALYTDLVKSWKDSDGSMGAWDKGLASLAQDAIPTPVEIGGKATSWWDVPGQMVDAALADKIPALEDNSRRLGEYIDTKFNNLGYTSVDGRPYSASFAPIKRDATEGEGAAVRASKTVPSKGPLKAPSSVEPLPTPKLKVK